jgi:signal peptidase I
MAWTPVARVTGPSMAPALNDGQIIGVRPLAWGGVWAGAVVLLTHLDERGSTRYVKRVAAVGGDVVTMEAGRLAVNGRSWDGRPLVAGARREVWRVPKGHVFVVGDNPDASSDSRSWEQPFVPLTDVQGVILRRRWPASRPRRAGSRLPWRR